MSKARVSSIIVLFLGLSALFLFGQHSPFNDNDPNAIAGPGEMSVQTNITKTFMPYDDSGNCTVMSILNPTLNNATVTITGYTQIGTYYTAGTFTIPKRTMVRICTAPVYTTAFTWQDAIFFDLTSWVAYAKITYPSPLKITAYIAFTGENSYDPTKAVPILPLALF